MSLPLRFIVDTGCASALAIRKEIYAKLKASQASSPEAYQTVHFFYKHAEETKWHKAPFAVQLSSRIQTTELVLGLPALMENYQLFVGSTVSLGPALS